MSDSIPSKQMFPRAPLHHGMDLGWTINPAFLKMVQSAKTEWDHFDHCDLEQIEEVLLALEKVWPERPADETTGEQK